MRVLIIELIASFFAYRVITKSFSGMDRVFFLVIISSIFIGCESWGPPANATKLDPKVEYQRDMVITVNGVTRLGTITMPLLEVNKIHVQAPGNLDVFLMQACGGTQVKEKYWNIQTEVKSGFFGWGKRKIDLKNQVQFEIPKSAFHDAGVCPLLLTGISVADGQHSEAWINWQTEEYKLTGELVCNMERRAFEGVESCDISTGSFLKLIFTEEVVLSPDPKCDFGVNQGKVFEFRAKSGDCDYLFETLEGEKRGTYHVHGWDEVVLRKQ